MYNWQKRDDAIEKQTWTVHLPGVYWRFISRGEMKREWMDPIPLSCVYVPKCVPPEAVSKTTRLSYSIRDCPKKVG